MIDVIYKVMIRLLLLGLFCISGIVFSSCTEEEQSQVSVESVRLNHDTLQINEGEEAYLIAEISPSNATNQSVKWSSDN